MCIRDRSVFCLAKLEAARRRNPGILHWPRRPDDSESTCGSRIMKRLNQLVTRLLIIALVLLAAWVGSAHLAKQTLVYHLESFVGAKVDAKKLQLSADEATVFLNQVEIANPNYERKNLLQFEAASLKIDFDELKNRRVVIEDGRLSQIKFGSPRTKPGQLERGVFDPPIESRPYESRLYRESGNTGIGTSGFNQGVSSLNSPSQKWRDSLVMDVRQIAVPAESSFHIIPMLEQKTQQWSQRFQQPHDKMKQVEEALAMVEEVLTVNFERRNPLREGSRLDSAVEAARMSRESLSEIGALISEFESQSRKDAYELSQVQIRDRQSLVAGMPAQKFESKLVNELLLGELQRDLVTKGLGWFQELRSSLPNPEADFRPVKRGRDVLFGTNAKPGLEIKKLQIDGATEFANSHFQFAGTVENIYSDPSASQLPMVFNLRAQGDPQIVVSGQVDRTFGKKLESIQFTGHSIPQPSHVLGKSDSVQISMSADSRLHVDAVLEADALDRISGTMTFTFENVIMHADAVHEVAGGPETAARINETVSSIDTFQVTSKLGGTISQPDVAFVSDLGPRVAASLESVFSLSLIHI